MQVQFRRYLVTFADSRNVHMIREFPRKNGSPIELVVEIERNLENVIHRFPQSGPAGSHGGHDGARS